jgi:DNA-binding CsgD family transcriptional regulator
MSEGFTNMEISKKLSIAHNTIKNHRKNIFRKSKCKNSGQLINKCITEGLI